MDAQHFERITAFIEDRLRPLFDAETGSDRGFAMDDTSRALRALRNTVLAASAAGRLNGSDTATPQQRQVTLTMRSQSWDVLRDIALHWEDHPDYLREFKSGSWEFDLAPAGAEG